MLQELHTHDTLTAKASTRHAESLVLYQGDAAVSLLQESDFLFAWNKLYEACPWASVFQSSAFVNSWYAHFGYKYHPIVAAAYDNGTLTGLLTMALPKNKPKGGKHFIVHAGHGEADVQSWLASPYNNEWFITGALEKIMKAFPDTDILLRCIAPGTPTQWASTHPAWVKRCIVERFSRPLIRMKDFSLSRRDRKRVNKLLQIARFEAIPDTETFVSYLDEIGVLYDFRHGAMFNRTPFMNDPAYRKLLISLFEQKVVTVTVLRTDDRILASIATTVGRNKAHLGAIICHSPVYADLSPGIVQFLLTAQYFTGQGLEYFDLTPGGDKYKNRLATGFDVLDYIMIANNKRFFMWRNFRNFAQESLKKMGIDPVSIKLYLHRKRYLIREKGISRMWRNNSFRLAPVNTRLLYSATGPQALQSPEPITVHVNALQDILKYQSKDGDRTRWEFMEAAMKRLENGYTAYTFATDKTLLCCVWQRPAQHSLSDAGIQTVLCDLHIHAKAAAQEESFLHTVIQAVAEKAGGTPVYLELLKKKDYTQLKLKKTPLSAN